MNILHTYVHWQWASITHNYDVQSVQFASWPVLRNKCHHILYFEMSEVLNNHFIIALKLRPGELIEIFIIGSWMDPCGPKIQIFLQPYM